jgi:hypothetical protein
MAYTKTTWTEATGITTARLNNLETQHDQAIAEAASMVNNAKPVIGSYVGTGSNMNINLGFKPKLVIISAVDMDVISREVMLFAFEGTAHVGFWFESGMVVGNWVEFKTAGIEIASRYSQPGIAYKYIAFR